MPCASPPVEVRLVVGVYRIGLGHLAVWRTMMRRWRVKVRAPFIAAAAFLATAGVSAAMSDVAHAAVAVSRAEVGGTRLRIEGQAAASRPITVDGLQMTTSSSTGSFKVDRSGYTAPADCTVD